MDKSDSLKPHPGTETYRRRCWNGLAMGLRLRRSELESKLRKQQMETTKCLSECDNLEKLYQAIQTLPPDVQDGFLSSVCTGV